MGFIEIFLIAIALSLDAFSVSISCGIKLSRDQYKKFIKIALAFGLFQAFMPILGHFLTNTFLKDYLFEYSRWITFTVFLVLGVKTFYDYFDHKKLEERTTCVCNGYGCLFSLSVATSIDAFLIGSVFGVQNQSLFVPVLLIGIVTFVNSIFGCLLGNKSVTMFKEKSRIIAGLILIFLAVHSLINP